MKNSVDSWDKLYCFPIKIKFSVMLFPTKEGDIYGYYISDNSKYDDLLKPIYTDFHYQNQTDPPDDLSEEEWDFRSQKWDELMSNSDTYTDCSFNFQIISGREIDLWDMNDRVKSILKSVNRDNKINDIIN
jgi:hypothetical protein